ncbi:MAG: hypothetical protein AB7N73_05455 [Gemmatimonadales bacterium]
MRATHRAASLAALVLAGCGSGDAPASGAATICDSCLVLDPVVVLEDETGERLSPSMRLAEWRGGFLASGVGEGSAQFAVFGPSGDFQRMLGEPGEGPGQFFPIKNFAVDPGTLGLVVLDRKLTRVDSAFVTQARVVEGDYAQAFRIVRTREGYVVNSYGGPSPLIFLDDSLQVMARIGSRAGQPDSNQFVLAAAADGGVWAARAAYAYEIRRHDGTGAQVGTLEPVREWFQRWSQDDNRAGADFRRVPLKPRITGLQELPDGRLAVLIVTADANFAPLPDADGEGPAFSPEEFDKYTDTVVEVIDSATGALLASMRRDELYGGITPEGLIWRLEYVDDTARAHLYRLVMR